MPTDINADPRSALMISISILGSSDNGQNPGPTTSTATLNIIPDPVSRPEYLPEVSLQLTGQEDTPLSIQIVLDTLKLNQIVTPPSAQVLSETAEEVHVAHSATAPTRRLGHICTKCTSNQCSKRERDNDSAYFHTTAQCFLEVSQYSGIL